MKPASFILTLSAAVISIHIATLPNPTQPQKDLGRTSNQIFLLGSQSLLKREDNDRHNKK